MFVQKSESQDPQKSVRQRVWDRSFRPMILLNVILMLISVLALLAKRFGLL
jgi:hypothetical protein